MQVRLYLPSFGFISIGYMVWNGGFGVDWGFFPIEPPREGMHRFAKHGSLVFITCEAWLDFGWWALWPIHFCWGTPGRFDPDVYDHATNTTAPFTYSSNWTGRTREAVAVVVFRKVFSL
jgi:hypothetical protein